MKRLLKNQSTYTLKNILKLIATVFLLVTSLSIPSIKVLGAVDYSQHGSGNTETDPYWYTAFGDEPNVMKNAVVPPDAVDSKINITDAFVLPGRYGIPYDDRQDWLSSDANYAYLSNSRDNVLVLYDGTTGNQKSSLWYKQKLNLNYPFEFEAYVMLTNINPTDTNGIGDGITFVLQNDPANGGFNAMGGRGGGIGVYPSKRKHYSMIYNAVTVEMDTYNNTESNANAKYDRDLVLDPWNLSSNLVWPHVAFGSTATSGNIYDYNDITKAPTEVFDNFKHQGVTNISAISERNSWFNKWVKINVKWSPNGTPGDYENISTGNLSYTWGPVYDDNHSVVQYEYNTKTWNNLNIDATFASEFETLTGWTKEKRLVTWGFAGSNFLKDNPFGVMITKLPNEPEVDVERKVRNTNVSGETFSSYTQAKVGDVLEYKVSVHNNSDNGVDIPLRNTEVREELENNQYVADSFTYSNTVSENATAPVAKIDGTAFTFTDYENLIEPGHSFEYTYRVIVDDDTTEFINNVEVESTYSTRKTFGETNVTVYPENVSLVKSVDETNPKVGDSVNVNLSLTSSKGLALLDTVKDTLPAGFELVADKTVFSVREKDGTISHSQALPDSVWTGSQATGYELNFDADNLDETILRELYGGKLKNNALEISYQIKPTTQVKGELGLILPKAQTTSTNKLNSERGTLTYSAISEEVSLDIKTDLTVYFKFSDETDLSIADIISTNPKFHNKNPVILYFNTNDTYDITPDIKEISENIQMNNDMTLQKVEGDAVSNTDISGTMKKAGNVINVYYTREAILTVEFINEANQVLDTHTLTLPASIGDKIDLTKEKIVTDKISELTDIGYAIEHPSNETSVEVNQPSVKVTYKVTGLLLLKSAPKTIDFGTLVYNAKTQRVEDPQYIGGDLIVVDNRSDASSGWEITAKLKTPMTNQETGTVLDSSIRYQSGTQEYTLTTNAQKIYTNNSGVSGTTNVSDSWDTTPGSNGIKLQIDSGEKVTKGVYMGTITWELMPGQP